MQAVEDTTALHRCGHTGLERIRRDGRLLDGILARNGDPVPFLLECNRDYRRIHLTMGGVADLLGIAYGWLAYRGEIANAVSFMVPAGGDRTPTASRPRDPNSGIKVWLRS